MYWIMNFIVIAKLIPHVCNGLLTQELEHIPDKCHPIPELLYRQCCVFPPFFIREVAKECGAIFNLRFINKKENVTGLRRQVVNGCKYWECILKKYFLLDTNGHVDDEKYFLHLDKWVDLNPSFGTVMLNAKVQCKMDFRMTMPFTACEFSGFQGCIRNFINVNCPEVIKTPECSEQKKFYEDCKEYFQ